MSKKKRENKKKEKKEIFEKIHLLVSNGNNVVSSCKNVVENTCYGANPIRVEYYRWCTKKEKTHGNLVLTKDEDSWLYGIVLAFATSHHPLTQCQAAAIIKRWKGLEGNRAGESSVKSFLKKYHNSLRCNKIGITPIRRLRRKTLGLVEQFVEVYKGLLDSGKYSEKNIINVDEKLLHFYSSYTPDKRIHYKGLNNAKQESTTSSGAGCVVPFISAEGKLVMQAYIFPITELKNENVSRDFCVYAPLYPKRNDTPVIYLFSKRGRNNQKCWAAMVYYFCEYWKLLNPGLHALMIFDGGCGHTSKDAIISLQENNIQGLFLPPNTTHFTQPLDDVPFGMFGKNLKNEISNYLVADTVKRRKIKTVISSLVIDISKESFTEKSIRAGFKHTGLFPFDEDLIKKRANLNVGNLDNDILPKDSPFREGYKVVKEMLRNKDPADMKFIDEVNVVENQVFLANDILKKSKKKNKKRKSRGKKGGAYASTWDEKSRQRYEEKKLRGEKVVEKKKKEEEGKEDYCWRNSDWLRENTCFIFRAEYYRGNGWEATDCETHWYCWNCRGLAHRFLAGHEESCEECKNSKILEKKSKKNYKEKE